MMTPTSEKALALEKLAERRASFVARGTPRINNADLVAGSPMYFYCLGCNEEIILPEDYTPPRPKYCYECQQLVDRGWLEDK